MTKLPVTEWIYGLSAIALVFLLPHFALLPIPFWYAVPVLIFVWLFLKRKNENFTDLGFSIRQFNWSAPVWGAICAVLLVLFLEFLFFPLLHTIVHLPPADLADFQSIRHHPGAFAFIILMAWLVGGFYEEIVFHGFIFTRIVQMMPGKKVTVISMILTNIIFGAYHFQLGITGMINAFIAGIAFQGLALKFNRNLWFAIFFHAIYDTIQLTAIFLGY